MSKKPKTLTFRIGPEDEAMIKQEQERFANQGLQISRSQAVRSLMTVGSTVTDEANGLPKSVSSKIFKKKGNSKK